MNQILPEDYQDYSLEVIHAMDDDARIIYTTIGIEHDKVFNLVPARGKVKLDRYHLCERWMRSLFQAGRSVDAAAQVFSKLLRRHYAVRQGQIAVRAANTEMISTQ